MRSDECSELLKWMLPILKLRWAGFRRVHKQVCKRLTRRLSELELQDAYDYRQYLAAHPEEWAVAGSLCTITISRFYRDKAVFDFLGTTVLPQLGAQVLAATRSTLLAWSAGCASGEEPYSLSLVWAFEIQQGLPRVGLDVIGTDIDDELLKRADESCYPSGCLRDLPVEWRTTAFDELAEVYCLREEYKRRVRFRKHDIRGEPPNGPFDIVLCRNLVFTYFDEAMQMVTAEKLHRALREGGALVLGRHEHLPPEVAGFAEWSAGHRVYRKLGPS